MEPTHTTIAHCPDHPKAAIIHTYYRCNKTLTYDHQWFCEVCRREIPNACIDTTKTDQLSQAPANW